MTRLFDHLTIRHWGGIFAGLSLMVLIAVFISQYGFGMQPCVLCVWQRWPFVLTLMLGALLWFRPALKKIWLPLLVAAFATSTGLAVFHVGVEQHWWIFASDCTAGNAIKPGATPAQMLEALKRAPVVRCDQAQPFLFGLSMAVYNVLMSTGLTVLAAVVAYATLVKKKL